MAGSAPGDGSPRESATTSRQGRAEGRDEQELSPPYRVLLRSLALPGWGQLENDQPLKAALVAVSEVGFMAAGYIEMRRSDRAYEAHIAAANAGDEEEAARQFVFYEDRQARAVGHFWWGAFTIMLSALDAYVDAHLRDFRADEVEDEVEEVHEVGEETPAHAVAPNAGPYAPEPTFHVAPMLDRGRVGLAVQISF